MKLIMKAHVQNVDLLRKEIDSWLQTLLSESGSLSEFQFQMLPGGLQEQLKSIAKHCQVKTHNIIYIYNYIYIY